MERVPEKSKKPVDWNAVNFMFAFIALVLSGYGVWDGHKQGLKMQQLELKSKEREEDIRESTYLSSVMVGQYLAKVIVQERTNQPATDIEANRRYVLSSLAQMHVNTLLAEKKMSQNTDDLINNITSIASMISREQTTLAGTVFNVSVYSSLIIFEWVQIYDNKKTAFEDKDWIAFVRILRSCVRQISEAVGDQPPRLIENPTKLQCIQFAQEAMKYVADSASKLSKIDD